MVDQSNMEEKPIWECGLWNNL